MPAFGAFINHMVEVTTPVVSEAPSSGRVSSGARRSSAPSRRSGSAPSPVGVLAVSGSAADGAVAHHQWTAASEYMDYIKRLETVSAPKSFRSRPVCFLVVLFLVPDALPARPVANHDGQLKISTDITS